MGEKEDSKRQKTLDDEKGKEKKNKNRQGVNRRA